MRANGLGAVVWYMLSLVRAAAAALPLGSLGSATRGYGGVPSDARISAVEMRGSEWGRDSGPCTGDAANCCETVEPCRSRPGGVAWMHSAQCCNLGCTVLQPGCMCCSLDA